MRSLYEEVVADARARGVLISGPSRAAVADPIDELLGDTERRALHGRCVPATGATFRPIAELIEGAVGLSDEFDESEAANALRSWMPDDRDEVLARLLDVLGVASRSYELNELFWAIRRFLQSAAFKGIEVVVIEDLQHAAPATIELLCQLLSHPDTPAFLFVCTSVSPTEAVDVIGFETIRVEGEPEDTATQAPDDHRAKARALLETRVPVRRAEEIASHLAESASDDAAAREAARWLMWAGARAHDRFDLIAAVDLCERALDLVSHDPELRVAHIVLADAYLDLNDAARAGAIADDGRRVAESAGERADAVWFAATGRLAGRRLGRSVSHGDAVMLVDAAVATGDRRAAARARQLAAEIHWEDGDYRAAEEELTAAFDDAVATGYAPDLSRVTPWLLTSLYAGPTPVPDAITRCEEMLQKVEGRMLLQAHCRGTLGGLRALAGDIDEGRALVRSARVMQRALGQPESIAGTPQIAAEIEMLAGDLNEAEAILRDALDAPGDPGYQIVTAAALARCLFAQGDLVAARRYADTCEDLARRHVPGLRGEWLLTTARLLVRDGRVDEALEAARDAVAAIAPQQLKSRADALAVLAEVTAAAGDDEEASEISRAAADLYAAKGIAHTPSA